MMTREVQMQKQYAADLKRRAAENVINWGKLDAEVKKRKAKKAAQDKK